MCAPQFKLYGLRVKCWTLIHWILSSSFDECICDFFCSQIETFISAKAETLDVLSLIPQKGLEPTRCFMCPLLLLIVLVSLSVGVTKSFLWVGARALKKSCVLA